jgi:hypothetical protein
MSLSKSLEILSDVQDIVHLRQKDPKERLNIDFKRVYIPKLDQKVRPLGVPNLSYRVYLSMLNNLLTFVRVDSVNNTEQHGYLPQKSILTA